MKHLVLALVLILSCGCADRQNEVSGDIRMEKFMKYSQMQSGYHDPDGAKMRQFLACWKDQTQEWKKKNGLTGGGYYADVDDVSEGFYLPPSARNFFNLAAELDWYSIYDLEEGRRFLKPSEARYFKDAMPMDYGILKEGFGDFHVDDRNYYLWNKNSQNHEIRGKDIDRYVVFGGEGSGIFYAQIAGEVSLDGETQFFFYSPHGGGERFKTFAHLLANFYLEEYQQVRDLDISMGNIYYFEDWDKTCVPILFDKDEIKSWGVGGYRSQL